MCIVRDDGSFLKVVLLEGFFFQNKNIVTI